MNSRDYERIKRQIEQRYADDMAALERTWQLAQGLTPSRPESESKPGDLTEAVRAAVNQIPPGEVFNKRIVTNLIRQTDDSIPELSAREAVGWILKRMSDAGEIQMGRVGKGKRPTDYTRSSNNGHAPALSLEELERDEEPEALPLPAE